MYTLSIALQIEPLSWMFERKLHVTDVARLTARRPLFVHDAVTTLSATDGLLGLDGIFCTAIFSTNE